jgi:hypothetical protein
MTEAVTASLFSWDDADGNAQTLDVDVVMAATDRRTAKLTDHVVETGAVITDHVVIQPEELTLELVVSQTPLRGKGFAFQRVEREVGGTKLNEKDQPLEVPPNAFQPGGFLLLSQGARAAVGAVIGLIAGASGVASTFKGHEQVQTRGTVAAAVLQSDEPVDRVNEVHDRLVEIMNSALPVTVSFKGKLYSEYLLTEIELNHGAGYFGGGKFKVQARAFHTVTGVAVKLPDPADFRAAAKKAAGNKPPKGGNPDPAKALRNSQAKHLKDGDGAGLDAVRKIVEKVLGG